MITNEDYKELIADYVINSKPTRIAHSTLDMLFEELKENDKATIIKIFKLIEFIKVELEKNHIQNAMNAQLNDELLKEIKEAIQAHQINMKMLGCSPLIGFLFNYYIYVRFFKSENKKFNQITKDLADELKVEVNIYQRDSKDKIVKKFYRLNMMRWRDMNLKGKFVSLDDMIISDRRKTIVKNNIERIYKKQIHKDSLYRLFVKIVVEKKLLSLKNANTISKKLFSTQYYDEKKINDEVVDNIYNNCELHLIMHCGIE